MVPPLSVTVVVTSHNYKAYIAEAIDSALQQTRAPAQVLVVDDGSSDGSAEFLASRYADDRRVQLHPLANAGQLGAFAAGVAECRRSDLVAFLDADDAWDPGYLEAVCTAFESNPSIDFVYTNLRFFGARDGLYHPSMESRDDGISTIQTCYYPIWRGSPTSAIVMRRNLAERLLEVSPDMIRDWRTRADDCLVYGADLMGAHKFYLGEPLARYRAHQGNVWLGQALSANDQMRHRLRTFRLFAFYRQRAGLDPACAAEHLSGLKREFLNKPQPTQRELKAYLKLVKRIPVSWFRHLRLGHHLRRHFRMTRPRS
jgi:glycosyltransferase involved in cell wall biosynthesis